MVPGRFTFGLWEDENPTDDSESEVFVVGGEPRPVRLVLPGQNVVDGCYGRLDFVDEGSPAVVGGEPLRDDGG